MPRLRQDYHKKHMTSFTTPAGAALMPFSDAHPHNPIYCSLVLVGGLFFLTLRSSKGSQYLGIDPRTSAEFTY